LEPQFLGERLETSERIVVIVAIKNIDRAVVDIAALTGLVTAIGGD